MNKRLNSNMIFAFPRHFDFSKGYGDTWEVQVNQTEEEEENETWMPIYNYLYPLPENFECDTTKIKEKLNNMTLIENEGYFYLALTGCGMDMTWEIAETYINLGLYPPIAFCELPAMAGRGESTKDKMIVERCNESLETAKVQIEGKMNHNILCYHLGKCTKCGYTWIPRVKNPKECPKCKTRIDYKTKKNEKVKSKGSGKK